MYKLKIRNKIHLYLDNIIIHFTKSVDDDKNRIFILQTSGIGDYILLRNFLELLKKQGYHITFCGNNTYKDLAETLDSRYVDDFVWVDIPKYKKNILYRIKIIKHLREHKYRKSIYPSQSRSFGSGDLIIRIVGSNEKIGIVSDIENSSLDQISYSDSFYNKLIDIPEDKIFEFNKHKYFFKKSLGIEMQLNRPEIKNLQKPRADNTKNNFFAISLGANNNNRIWDPKNFALLADKIIEHSGMNLYLIGSKKDRVLCDTFLNELKNKDKVTNLVGTIDLTTALEKIEGSQFFIGNESSGTHIATALDKTAFCISNGERYGRFSPYPTSTETKTTYFYPKHEDINNKVYNIEGYDIDSIDPVEVYKKISKLIKV